MNDVAADGPDDGEETFYDRVGGHATFERLVDEFFRHVWDDPLLMTMYDANDLAGARHRLLMFLEQYWGGPMTYSLTRGAPMLRMRHMPFRINNRAREAWLACMHQAIASLDLALEDDFLLRDYVERAARYLINADD